jgi:hypothetical protein
MARGRMLNKMLAHSVQFTSLANDTHRLLFLMAIPNLDRDGRMSGNPRAFRAIACPMLDHVTDDTVRAAFDDFKRLRLIEFYVDEEGQEVYESPSFARQQQGMRYSREGPSKFGANPSKPRRGQKSGPTPPSSGPTPDLFGAAPDSAPKSGNVSTSPNSATGPELVRSEAGGRRPNGIEGKGSGMEIKSQPLSLSSNQQPRAQARACDAGTIPPPAGEGGRERGFSPEEGTRCSPTWEPSDELIRWAESDPFVDLPGRVVEMLKGEFRDYWIAMPGQRAYKADWQAQARIYLRVYRHKNPHAPRASDGHWMGGDIPPPPKHPEIERIEAEMKEKSEPPDTSELMAAMGRVGVVGKEEK